MARPQAMPCPREPSTGLGSPAIKPSSRTLPEVLRGVVKVQDAYGIGRKALGKQAPQPSPPITKPDHLGSVSEALAQRFEPETRREGFNIPQDGHEPALPQPSDHLACKPYRLTRRLLQ